MATEFSFDSYTGDGAQTNYNVNSDYLDKDHIEIKIDGTVTTDWSWIDGSTIQFDTAPASGAFIFIKRKSSQGSRLVDWADPSTLDDEDLNEDSKQAFFMSQEAIDTANRALTRDDADDKFDADGKVIKNVSEPSASQDAATKNYIDSQIISAGNVPVPDDPSDDDKVLSASGGAFSWTSFVVSKITDVAAFMATFLKSNDAATARQNIGVDAGTHLSQSGNNLNVTTGTGPNQIVELDGTSKLPAVDGSALTNIVHPKSVDQAARDIGMTAFIKADDGSGVQGPITGSAFTSDDLAVSTNANYDAGNDLYDNVATGYTSNQVPVMTSNSAPSGTVTASSETQYPAWHAFDGDDHSTGWETTFSNPEWIAYEFTSAKTITRYTLHSYVSSNDRPPTDFEVQGSNDGSNWDTLDTQSSLSWSINEEKTFDVSSPGSYTHYRLWITDQGGNPSVNVARWEMFENVTPDNVTLSATPDTLDNSDPSDTSIYMVVGEVNGADAASNVKVSQSIDGGSTQTTAVVADAVFAYGSDKLLRFDADTSGQTGSSYDWELTTENNDEFKFKEWRATTYA